MTTLRAACPDWRTLAASRDQRDQPDLDSERFGPDWSRALEHLDGGCRACRDAAYAADPTLVFRRVPTVAADPDEIADLTASVHAMIRAGRVETLAAPSAREVPLEAPEPLPQRPVLRWRVASLAAALVALLIGTAPAPVGRTGADPAPEATATAAPASPVAGASWTADSRGLADPVEIETLDRPFAKVYQFDDPGMAVVLIVDAGLDV